MIPMGKRQPFPLPAPAWPERLERWLERAAVAGSITDVLDEPS
jgi:hypothetical protein